MMIGCAAILRNRVIVDLFEIAIVLAIALVVLGPERLPEVIRTAAKLLRELRLASNTIMREIAEAIEEEPDRSAEPAVRKPLREDPVKPIPPASPSGKP
ncbi:MAG TPA: twin-arginine translocase TatA/TatE family subunit [Candidatus Binataceae bacterium]|nr:twin-arginine translocase TatA/TatE family subunit [Candidatus Binataceae bacterium]